MKITMPKQSQAKNLNLTYVPILETHDINFAAYLRACHKLRITNMEKDRQGRVTWFFELGDLKSSQLMSEFYSGGSVSAVDYAAELKSLKSAIYNL